MTDVDTALTREENQSDDQDLSGIARQSTSVPGVDPYAPPPAVPRSLTFVAEQRNGGCFTMDSTVQTVLFKVDARGIDPEIGPPHRCSLNLALVVDRSGSMEGRWLDSVKRACNALLDIAGPTDFVSVVAFAETADLILPARHVVHKTEARDRINKIAAGNTTNLHQGLVTAFNQLTAVKNSGTLSRVILITDGGPTAGTKDSQAILSQVVEQKSRGISVTAVGLGSDYDEELLGGIASRTGGNFYHVPDPDHLADVLKSEFDELARVVARNLRLRVRLTRGAGVRQVYGHPPIYGNGVVELELGVVDQNRGLRSLWDFELSTRSPGRYRIGQADLRYDDLNTGRPERIVVDLIYDFALGCDDITPSQSAIDFDAELVVAEAVRTIDKTLLAVRRQNLEAAVVIQELEKVKAIFSNHGRHAAAAVVAETAAKIQAGGSIAKILTNTVYNLDQGKT